MTASWAEDGTGNQEAVQTTGSFAHAADGIIDYSVNSPTDVLPVTSPRLPWLYIYRLRDILLGGSLNLCG